MANQAPKIQAEARPQRGSRYARRLRREGKLPAVLYGHGEAPDHLTLDQREVVERMEEGAHLLEVQHDGQSETCLIKDVQFDYLGTNLIHVDLARIRMSEEVTVSVPIQLHGEDECPGAQEEGAYVDRALVDLTVSCRADAIPEQIDVDISHLQVNDALLIQDLKLPEGVRVDYEPDEVVVAVHVAQEEPEEAPEEAEGAEPEVIGEASEQEGAEGEGESGGEPDEEGGKNE